MAGKSSLISAILSEKEQFKEDFEKIIYIFSYEDENIAKLRKKFSKKGYFAKEIPSNLEEMLIPGKTILCIDDKEDMIFGDKEKLKIIYSLAKVWTHHLKIITFLILQSYDCFYKRHPLNTVLQQCTKLILFKTVSNVYSLKRWLNSYAIKLKANQTLFEVFRSLESRYAYLVIDLSTNLNNAQVYSNILYADPKPFLIFHAELDES